MKRPLPVLCGILTFLVPAYTAFAASSDGLAMRSIGMLKRTAHAGPVHDAALSRRAERLEKRLASLHGAAGREASLRRFYRLIDSEREKAGLPPFAHNPVLEHSARAYAEHLRSVSCFSHDACGSTLKERMHASGYYQRGSQSYQYGENIARGQESDAEAVDDWMHSPSHRDAILSTEYQEIGLGRSGEYRVIHFGSIEE